MNRRNFVGRLMAGAAAVSVFAMTGVTSACFLSGTVFTQIMTYVGIGLTAFQAVVGLLDPPLALAMAGAIALVKAGFADLQLAVQDYNNAPAGDKTTLKDKIAVVLQDLQAEIQTFWGGLSLPGPLGLLVKGLIGIIISTLAGFAGQLPVPLPSPASLRAKALPNPVPVEPKARTKKQFETEFNKAMTDAGYPAVKFS
jgi:hypothetical protein